jgi:hypothetical protein
MPQIVMVLGSDASVLSLSAQSYQQIADILGTVPYGANAPPGGWLGPRPRVTRYINTGATSAWIVRFAQPWAFPDGVTAAQQATLRAKVLAALTPFSRDWVVSIVPYAEAVNGPLSDWVNGALSVTQTQDLWPTAGGRLDVTENPVGPTSAATHPGSLAQAAASATTGLTDLLKAAWPILALGVGVFVADKFGAFSRKAPKREARASTPFAPAGAVSNPDPMRNSIFGFDTVRMSPSESQRWRADGAFRRKLGGQLHQAAKRSGRDVMLMDSRLGYVTTIQPNPRPPEWGQYAPSTPYPCHPWEAGILGLHVPGRGGGTVTACATPAEPLTAKRRRGQVQIGLPGVGGVMPKSRARGRVRRAGLETLRTPIEDVAQAVRAYSGSTCPLPYAPGLEFPHTVSRCDPEHKIWKGYADAIADAQERASIEAPESAGPEEFECLVRQALESDPRFPVWDAAAQACVRGFDSRESARRGKAAFSQQRERGQARARAVASGVDVSGAEYRDTLRSAERGQGKRRKR